MRESKSEIEAQIRSLVSKMNLASASELSLISETNSIYNRMLDKGIKDGPIGNRVSTALFLACDGNACIAIPKVKSVCGSQLKGRNIRKIRAALQISHGTAHEKLSSLCERLNVADLDVKRKAHLYVDLLEDRNVMFPTHLAVVAFHLANWETETALTVKEMSEMTGCSEQSILKNIRILIHEQEKVSMC